MSEQLVNEILGSFGGFLNQQDHTHTLREMFSVAMRNLDDAVFDRRSELYRIHAFPLLRLFFGRLRCKRQEHLAFNYTDPGPRVNHPVPLMT